MDNDFKTLIDFLDRLGPEVRGHEYPQPTTRAVVQLKKFSKGGCDERERTEVCEMLRVHPHWIHWMADQIKGARPKAAAVDQSTTGGRQ